MLTAVLIICAVNCLMLVVLLLLQAKNRGTENRLAELERALGGLKEVSASEHRQLMDQLSRQSETTVTQFTSLGSTLRYSMDTRLTRVEEGLRQLKEENSAALERIRLENRASLDHINDTVNEKLQKTLDERISRSFALVNERLAQVYEGLGEMKNVASGVSDLKNVLSNVKNRGILGELQLSAILGDILSPEQYEAQCRMVPGSAEAVDFAVRLPGAGDGEFVYLPIDAKFPGDTWASLADAYDAGDPAALKERRAALEQELLRCARSIRQKYIVPPHSTDFAIMFLPFEGLYAEAVNLGLVERLQRECRVSIAGPSTMAAMLNSLQMGFRTLAIQKKSGEVWKILESAKAEFLNFEKGLDATRRRLQQADDELEKLIGVRTRAINRRLRDVSAPDALAPGGEDDFSAAEALHVSADNALTYGD